MGHVCYHYFQLLLKSMFKIGLWPSLNHFRSHVHANFISIVLFKSKIFAVNKMNATLSAIPKKSMHELRTRVHCARYYLMESINMSNIGCVAGCIVLHFPYQNFRFTDSVTSISRYWLFQSYSTILKLFKFH